MSRTREGRETEAVAGEVAAPVGLGRAMGIGLSWSLLNNVVGRLGNFLAGIVVVRLLAQQDYGTYAVGLVVLTVLLSVNELGVSVAVVQYRGDPRQIAPTVMTVSVLSSTALATAAFMAAPAIASLMGTPAAAGLIRLLVLCVVLDGISCVPNAYMSRLFQQRKRLVIDTIAFFTGTPVVVVLAVTGHGAWSLGWGALVGNLTTTALALLWSPVRVVPGWRSDAVAGLLRFGLPLGGASLLALLMLNIDYVVVGHTLGTAQLGLYLLAFNLCSWPITVVTSAVRRVAVALFARLSEGSDDGGGRGFGQVLVLVLGITLPLCILVGGFGLPLITLLYGPRWNAAAAALTPLVVLTLARVAVEVTYDFLAGSGRSSSTVWLHGIWLVVLAPALILGARSDGIHGVAVAQAVVALAVVVPVLGLLWHRAGVPGRALASQVGRECLGALVMTAVVLVSRAVIDPPVVAMLVGGCIAVLAYGACLTPLRRDALELWNLPAAEGVRDPA